MWIKKLLLVVGVVGWTILGVSCATHTLEPASAPLVRLETVPPSPVSDQIRVDLRGAVVNPTRHTQAWQVAFYLDRATPRQELYHQEIRVKPGQSSGVYDPWQAKGHAGRHHILLVARRGDQTLEASQPLHVVASATRSMGRIGGAWCEIYHWSETEGRYWNPQIKRMTDRQWQGLIRAMHDVGMNIVVMQEAFDNDNTQVGAPITLQNYPGKAFYPSRLYPGRMPIAAKDPFEAILSEADRLGMHVFMPLGLYAWRDYTPASLTWHERVASELWRLYGQHPSFYGWYISEESAGNLGANASRRQQIVAFFRKLTPYLRRLAPEKPVMLAPNCWGIRQGLHYYPQLLTNVDILCPFAFDRMPKGDLSGTQAATLLQRLCDRAGTHLWLDMEAFTFDHTGALIPRPISGVLQTLRHYTNFEETLCYQFPGLLTAPWMSPQLGGPRAVKLYKDYQQFLEGRKR